MFKFVFGFLYLLFQLLILINSFRAFFLYKYVLTQNIHFLFHIMLIISNKDLYLPFTRTSHTIIPLHYCSPPYLRNSIDHSIKSLSTVVQSQVTKVLKLSIFHPLCHFFYSSSSQTFPAQLDDIIS